MRRVNWASRAKAVRDSLSQSDLNEVLLVVRLIASDPTIGRPLDGVYADALYFERGGRVYLSAYKPVGGHKLSKVRLMFFYTFDDSYVWIHNLTIHPHPRKENKPEIRRKPDESER